ncbi:MAG: hypothetical protein ABJB11_03175 [Ferruginibacter sp.]
MNKSDLLTIIEIPRNVSSELIGYEFLADLNFRTYNLKNSMVTINFINNDLFEENLCSTLGSIIDDLKQRGNLVVVIGLQENIEDTFKKNGFYKIISPEHISEINYSKIIEFKKFRLEEIVAFQKYLDEQLLTRDDLPIMSELLRKKINKSILEIFNNAHIHGGCEHIYTSGLYSVREKVLKFSISDMGVTIRKNVNLFFGSGRKIDGKNSITWAVEEGHTTRKGKIPGGLGLSLIREFLTLNKGTIQIISSDGFWQEKSGIAFTKNLKKSFLGTIVNFEFNLNDDNYYVLASELNVNNVL